MERVLSHGAVCVNCFVILGSSQRNLRAILGDYKPELWLWFETVFERTGDRYMLLSSIVDKFSMGRKKATVLVTLYTLIGGLVVCLGYNLFYFEFALPNGTVAQVLDVLDYISNYLLMPIVAIATCILIGWVLKPASVIEEVTSSGCHFGRQKLYTVMVKFVTPVMLLFLLLQALGLLKF